MSTDRYSLPSQHGDPAWAVSREPAPPLWTWQCNDAACTECPFVRAESLDLAASGWRLVEGTGSPVSREAQP